MIQGRGESVREAISLRWVVFARCNDGGSPVSLARREPQDPKHTLYFVGAQILDGSRTAGHAVIRGRGSSVRVGESYSLVAARSTMSLSGHGAHMCGLQDCQDVCQWKQL